MLNSPNAPGGQAVEAVIVGSTEGGHDVVHLLAVRLQRLPLRHQVRVLPNLVQPEQFPFFSSHSFSSYRFQLAPKTVKEVGIGFGRSWQRTEMATSDMELRAIWIN